jgi:hypothetical protein
MMGGSASLDVAGVAGRLAGVKERDVPEGRGLDGDATTNIPPTPTTSTSADVATSRRACALPLFGAE